MKNTIFTDFKNFCKNNKEVFNKYDMLQEAVLHHFTSVLHIVWSYFDIDTHNAHFWITNAMDDDDGDMGAISPHWEYIPYETDAAPINRRHNSPTNMCGLDRQIPTRFLEMSDDEIRKELNEIKNKTAKDAALRAAKAKLTKEELQLLGLE